MTPKALRLLHVLRRQLVHPPIAPGSSSSTRTRWAVPSPPAGPPSASRGPLHHPRRDFSSDFSSARVENGRSAPTHGHRRPRGPPTREEARTMTKVTAQMSVSLDGFYTGPR